MNYFGRAVNANKGAMSPLRFAEGLSRAVPQFFPGDGAEAAFDKTPLRRPPRGGSPRAEFYGEDPSALIR